MQMPVFIADQVYGLRAHIGFVRDRLNRLDKSTILEGARGTGVAG